MLPAPTEHTLRRLDRAAAVWVIVWMALGVAIGLELAHLADLGHTVAREGSAVQSVGGALAGFAEVPLVGATAGQVGASVAQAGANAAAGGASAASTFHVLSVLIPIVVVGLATTPVLGVYLPWRRHARRAPPAG